VESYARGATEPALLEETIGANLERTVRAHPDREALVEVATGRRWTWAELDRDVDALARGFLGAGLEVGDRVGIWAPNSAEWTLVQYATAKAGIVLVNVNPAYRTHELSYAVNQSGLRVLVAASSFRTSDYRAMVEEVRDQCPTLERVVFLDTDDWAALLEEGRDLPEEALAERMAALSPDDPINIQYTSGTTGFPKGATLSHRNILNNGYLTTELIGFTEVDRLCIPVPFYHCFGMVMGNLGCTSHGATMVIPAPAFDPEVTLRAIAEERCTAVYGVPTMFIAMQAHPSFAEHDLSSLRTGIMAGSTCPVEVMRRCVDDMHMAEASIAYGMTETSPVSCQTRVDDDLERRTATIGRVHPHVEIKVVDPVTGETVPRGEPGEFCTRGYSVMLGYWDDPARPWTPTGGCTPATSRSCARTATARSSAGSRTWSSAAGRTSTRARSRSSSTPTPTSRTSRSSASPTSGTARSSAPGSGCAPAPTGSTRTPSVPSPPASWRTTRSRAT
jgi:fatty-acyl-CoA synthase